MMRGSARDGGGCVSSDSGVRVRVPVRGSPLLSQTLEGSHDGDPPLTCKREWGVGHHFPSRRCHGSLTTSRACVLACVPFFPFFIFFAHLKLSSIYPPSRGLASPSRSPSLPSPDSAPERPGTARVLGTSASVWWHADAGGDVQLQGGGVLRMQWGA
jgi:hypothetical protein